MFSEKDETVKNIMFYKTGLRTMTHEGKLELCGIHKSQEKGSAEKATIPNSS